MSNNSIFERLIKQQLKAVVIRELNKNLLDSGLLKNILFEGDIIKLVIDLPADLEIDQKNLEQNIKRTLLEHKDVRIVFSSKFEPSYKPKQKLDNVQNVLLFSATKGGVGKSTSALNSAIALSTLGYSVGILDADIYGPTIPQLLGISKKPEFIEKKMIPINYKGVYSMSLGYLVDDEQAAMWRGPMLSKVLHQLILGVVWPDLDFLIVDMPPGTGDVYISLTENFVINGVVLVTTPQTIAINMLKKSLSFFKRMNISLLGVIENMSCFYDTSGNKHDIFGTSNEDIYKALELNLLARIPISSKIVQSSSQEFEFSQEPEFFPYIEIAEKLLRF